MLYLIFEPGGFYVYTATERYYMIVQGGEKSVVLIAPFVFFSLVFSTPVSLAQRIMYPMNRLIIDCLREPVGLSLS